jgi:hypothetical protein
MCEIGWDSELEYWTHSKRKARKQHVCDGCGGPIRPGESYVHDSWLCDGKWESEKACAACDAVMAQFAAGHDGQPVPSYLAECLRGCINEMDPESARWKPLLEALEARGRSLAL